MIKKNINSSVIFHAIQFSEAWKKNGELLTKQFDITTQQWIILLLLANDPNFVYLQKHHEQKNLVAKEIADILNVSRANITNLLNILIEKKLITQSEDGADKRRKILTLTKTGVQVVEKLEKIRQKKNAAVMSKFSNHEKERFIKFIKDCLITMNHG
jgi:DNA-binding MarR family transcriptional regulator